jgi:hypothetical protein
VFLSVFRSAKEKEKNFYFKKFNFILNNLFKNKKKIFSLGMSFSNKGDNDYC